LDEKNDLPMKVATFRFGTIADFVTGAKLAYGDKERLLTEKASRVYEIPGSGKTRISRATLLSWVTLYRKGGYKIEALCPRPRADRGTYPSLSTTLRMAIRTLKDENEYYTVPVIIKKLRQQQLLGADEPVNRATIYRFLRQENLKAPSKDALDRRRFEAEKSNDVWQCDVLHGPLVEVFGQAALKKAYLMAIIDDHSRFIVHAAFYLSETFETLKDALHQAVSRRGLPQKFYVDNGSCYRSDQLEHILACLGIQLSHSPPYRPQGRGKIERWFKNIRDSFLPMLPKEALSLAALNDRLADFVDDYNGTEHGSTKETPYERYRKDLSCVRAAPEQLLGFFRRRDYRRVKKDRTVQIKGRVFEVPAKLIDKTVELLFHAETPEEVEVVHQGLSYGRGVPLNLAVNAKGGRDYAPSEIPTPVKTPDAVSATPLPDQGGRLFEGVVGSRGDES
jgi:transposase InsO family protein